MEYLIKSYRRLEEIYRVWWEEPKLALYMDREIRKFTQVIVKNRFFDRFFRSPEDEGWADRERAALWEEFESRKLFDTGKSDRMKGSKDERKEE